MDKKKNIFVQGAANPDTAAQTALEQLGKWAKKVGSTFHVGSKGKISGILETTGATCIRHDFGGEETEASDNRFYLPIARVVKKAVSALLASFEEIAWGLRLVNWISQCDSYVFFKGDAGTAAHLFPVLAFAKKRWAKDGKPRKVILIGWHWQDALAIQTLAGFTPSSVPGWFRSFDYSQIEEATKFLAK